jgi:predicted neutral ceramidase superfamily lipid hydrolase
MSQESLNAGRHETEVEKLDRNWDELLQELRVVQTGVQILAGFLLTLPFQQRFTEIEEVNRRVYLVAFCLTVVATAFLVAPVASHRLLFRKREKATLVAIAHVCARIGLVALALAVAAVAFVIFDVVTGTGGAVVASAAILLLFLVNWLLLPLGLLRRDRATLGDRT